MLIVGIIITVFAVLVTLFKLYVVWDISRDIFNGGGAPTLDFVIFYPGWLVLGIDVLLDASKKIPFRGFGVALYLTLVVVFFFIHQLLFLLGAPARKAGGEALTKLAEIKRQQKSDSDSG